MVAELVDWTATKDLYRGLHFSATDIPAQARELYTLNKVRLLYDRDQPSARLVCAVEGAHAGLPLLGRDRMIVRQTGNHGKCHHAPNRDPGEPSVRGVPQQRARPAGPRREPAP